MAAVTVMIGIWFPVLKWTAHARGETIIAHSKWEIARAGGSHELDTR